jgi:hypothetical protein
MNSAFKLIPMLFVFTSLSCVTPVHVKQGNAETPTDSCKQADFNWIKPVLEDSLQKTDRFGIDERRNAFSDIRACRLDQFLPTVRQIASMEYRGEPPNTEDIISIYEALNLLTLRRDPEAVSLNRARLNSDPLLETAAISNLDQLQDWSVTLEVQKTLESTPAEEKFLTVIAHGIGFLGHSPETTATACPIARRIAPRFLECFTKEEAGPFCTWIKEGIAELDRRFACAASL